MLAGLPCVATDVGDCKVLVGGSSELVPPGDAKHLAEALDKMLQKSDAEKRSLGIQGRQRVIDMFSIASVALRYQQLYSKLQDAEDRTTNH